MTIKSLILAVFGLLPSLAMAFGDEVNNGGGRSEQNITYAYTQLAKYISLCMNSSACKLSEKERGILTNIVGGLSAEYANPKQLQFLKDPSAFMIDGEVKVAKTGSAPGAPIFFNLDLIYSKNATGKYEAMDLAEAVSILVHEMGHHYGQFTHAELDLLGVKVSLVLSLRLQTTPLLPDSRDTMAMVFNGSEETSFPDVLLYVHNEVINLTDALKKATKCPVLTLPVPVDPIPDLDLVWTNPFGVRYHNIYWQKSEEHADKATFIIKGDLTNLCRDQLTKRKVNRDFKGLISFNLKHQVIDGVGKWQLDRGSLKVVQIHEPWWKIIHLPTDFIGD